MLWTFPLIMCVATIIKSAKCQPAPPTLAKKQPEWKEGHPELVYPQLHTVDNPKVKLTSSADTPLLILKAPTETFYIELKPNVDLVKPNASIVSSSNSTRPCHYHGNVLSHMDGMAAISICGPENQVSGIIMVRNEAFVLRPLDQLEDAEKYQHLKDASSRGLYPHFITKVDSFSTQYCGLNHNENLLSIIENEINEHHRLRRSANTTAPTDRRKVIETAIFVDKALYNKHIIKLKQTEEVLRDTVLAIINQVQIIYNYQSLKIKFKIAVVKLEFLKDSKEAPDPGGGDIDEYLDNFCSWQSGENPPEPSDGHWDHAIMLSGHDLHKIVDGKKNKKVLGLAWVNGMCRPKHSCTLNEGSSFEAAFVIAHEMGHSLGMMHDGTNNDCDSSGYLMAEKTGPGRTQWSSCSNDYLLKFFQKGRGRCLEDENHKVVKMYQFEDQLPGQRFDIEHQCVLSLGPSYRPHVFAKAPFDDVCRELWCVSGLWASSAHPALEGSSCNIFGGQCVQGKCKSKRQFRLRPDARKLVADYLERFRLMMDIILP